MIPYKYNFPRIRNLPNKVFCKDETGELDCIFFNSYEGYVKKILPLNKEVTISGKINRYKDKYQLTNPKYISENSSLVKDKHNRYSLTDGITEIKDPDGEMLGSEGFQNYIKKYQSTPNNNRLKVIIEDIVKSGKIQKDDLTIVVIDGK